MGHSNMWTKSHLRKMPEVSCMSDTHPICPVAQSFINLLYSFLIEMADCWRGPRKGWSDLPVRDYPPQAVNCSPQRDMKF